MSQLIIKFEENVLLSEEFNVESFSLDLVKLKLPTLNVDGDNFIISISNNSIDEALVFRNKFIDCIEKY